ncbi:MAG TPA: hypothetical protein GXZ37_07975 [Clostridiales bacterium]|nr:hypothetical protein [Clostridiales bacterium]
MYYLNLAACVFLIGVIIVEIWFILHVNKQIRIKGKDDFFTGALVMLFVILIFPLTENLQMIEIVRNILLLAALFATMAVRRGLTDRGVQKLFFTIPWEKLDEVLISEGQMNKVQVVFRTKTMRFKLIFPRFKLKELVFELQKHVDKVSLQKSLQKQI